MSNKDCGIYYIQNKVTGQVYLGQTSRLKDRSGEHFYLLRKGCHFNKHLQNSFNKYGEAAFEFNVIEYCDPEFLSEYESAYIDMFNLKKYGFNIRDGGVNAPPTEKLNLDMEKIKKLYLSDYSSYDIAKIFNCSRRTINRRLNEIFSKEELNLLKNKKIYDKNPNRLTFDYDKLSELYLAGYSSVEIGKMYGCGHEPICKHLKIIFGEKYDSLKFNSLYRKFTKNEEEFIRSSLKKKRHLYEIQSSLHCSGKTLINYILSNLMSLEEFEEYKKHYLHRKYFMWDNTMVKFYKNKISKKGNFTKCFRLLYNAYEVPIGGFIDFVSPEIINCLINEFS